MSSDVSRVSVASLVESYGQAWLIRRAEIEFPDAEDVFLRRLSEEVDRVVRNMEDDAHHHNELGEVALSKIMCRQLQQAGYRAAAEADTRGHVDITVEDSRQLFRWLGESKIHSGYDYLMDGLSQLIRRYSAGRDRQGGMLIFVRVQNAALVMARWRDKLVAERPHGFTQAHDDTARLCFRGMHQHPGSGETYCT